MELAGLVLVLCLRAPVPGPVIAPYAPQGNYAGHHGVDFSAAPGDPVRAAGPGVVTFAGSVAGMLTVTVDHGDGLKSTVSYLDEVFADQGSAVVVGAVLGAAGQAHERSGVHFSVRVHGAYVDPMPYLLCGGARSERLYLLPPPPASYPRHRVERPHGRNLRSSPHRPPARR